MSVDRCIPLISILLLFVISVSSFAEDPIFPSAEPDKFEWHIGISVFQTDETDPALESAAALLPRLILDELSGADIHKLTDLEKEYLAREAINALIYESYKKLNSLYADRDRILFDINTDPSGIKKIDLLIEDELGILAHWSDYSPWAVIIPDEVPVVYTKSSEGGDIWEQEGIPAEPFLKSVNLDTLITGSVVRVGEYFGIRISAFSPAGEETVLWEGAGSENEFEAISMEAGAAARRLVLGRPWAALSIQTEPPDSIISINGNSVGVGYWSDSTLIPGNLAIEVTAAGHSPEIMSLDLEKNEIRNIEISLEKSANPQILVRTEPTGATVRLGSLWLGRAPIAVDLPDRVMSLTVEKEGYRTRTVPLYPETERLTIPMESLQVDPLDELNSSRRKMQSSVAWFSFSLAPTIILLGVSQNYANMFLAAQDAGNYDDQVAAYDAYNLTYGLMWGSVAINIGLLTNVIFKLIRYLNAAEDLSN